MQATNIILGLRLRLKLTVPKHKVQFIYPGKHMDMKRPLFLRNKLFHSFLFGCLVYLFILSNTIYYHFLHIRRKKAEDED